MDIYSLFGNRELFKVIYALFILLVCFFIVYKTNKLYKLSMHNGIRYFRNAFFFYGLGFVLRYFLGFFIAKELVIDVVFEFFLIMAGFFLLYSLIWKKFETKPGNMFSSLLNPRIIVFYILTIMVIILDAMWTTYYFMFVSQIIIFLFASGISLRNYIKDNNQHPFLKFYFIAMLISLIAWILNALAATFFSWNLLAMADIYLLNLIFFLLFAYGVVKVTKN